MVQKIVIPDPDWTIEATRVSFGTRTIPVAIKFRGFIVFTHFYKNNEDHPDYEDAEFEASATFAQRLGRLLEGM